MAKPEIRVYLILIFLPMEKITSLLVAPFTAYRPDGEINTDIVGEYASLLKKNGIGGAFINGSSGEGYLLTTEERMLLAEAWTKQQTPEFKVMVHVGATCLKDSRQLAQHAASIGAWGIGSMAPPFPPIGRVNELVDYCATIADATPQLPFYFYHIPVFNHVGFPMLDFLKAADGVIPNLAGIKYTHENLYDFNQCMLYKNGKYDMLHGQDETLLAGLALSGIKGGISGTGNYIGNILTGVIKAWNRQDTEQARKLQNYAQEVINVICHYRGNIVAGKCIMKLLGLDLGPNRTPFRNMTDDEQQQMKLELEAIDFFHHCNTI